MAMKLLGQTIDIHTGGIDHIPTHHNNEIAQSEAATHQPFARFWLHGAHLLIDGQKISKSLGNTVYLKDLAAHGVTPLGLRYWYLTASYHTQMNFTWEAVKGAQTAHDRLLEQTRGLLNVRKPDSTKMSSENTGYKTTFLEAVNDDLNTPKALSTVWDMLKDTSLSAAEKMSLLLDFDKVLGLQLSTVTTTTPRANIFPAEIIALKDARDLARQQKDFKKSDELRMALKEKGYDIVDTAKGSTLVSK